MNVYDAPPKPEEYVVLECLAPNLRGLGDVEFSIEPGYLYPCAMFPVAVAAKIMTGESVKKFPTYRYGIRVNTEKPVADEEETTRVEQIVEPKPKAKLGRPPKKVKKK